MPNDEDRHTSPLGKPHELSSHFLNLADATGSGGNLFRIHRLDRIDHHGGRLNFLHRFQNLFKGGFGQDQQMWMCNTQPLPTHLDLPGRLFSGNVQNRRCLCR